MSEDEIKELIQTELEESGYMYTLGMLKGMYKAGAFNVVEWCTLTMYLDDLNMEILGWQPTSGAGSVQRLPSHSPKGEERRGIKYENHKNNQHSNCSTGDRRAVNKPWSERW